MKVYKIIARESGILSALLSTSSKLSPEKIADACTKGAVWLQKGGKGKILKERNANYSVKPQDILTLFYDPRVLSMPNLTPAFLIHTP